MPVIAIGSLHFTQNWWDSRKPNWDSEWDCTDLVIGYTESCLPLEKVDQWDAYIG